MWIFFLQADNNIKIKSRKPEGYLFFWILKISALIRNVKGIGNAASLRQLESLIAERTIKFLAPPKLFIQFSKL